MGLLATAIVGLKRSLAHRYTPDSRPTRLANDRLRLAERVGFEPTDPVKDQRFSRPPRSTTLAPLRTSPSHRAQSNSPHIRGQVPTYVSRERSERLALRRRERSESPTASAPAGEGIRAQHPDPRSGVRRPEAHPRRHQRAKRADGGEGGIRTHGRFPLHTLSRRAPSATRSPLRVETSATRSIPAFTLPAAARRRTLSASRRTLPASRRWSLRAGGSAADPAPGCRACRRTRPWGPRSRTPGARPGC